MDNKEPIYNIHGMTNYYGDFPESDETVATFANIPSHEMEDAINRMFQIKGVKWIVVNEIKQNG